MNLNQLQEKLVALYLRLNGYSTTGLILHSPNENEVEGEIDIIGVRFWQHSQPDRIIECSQVLEIPKDTRIDIIIGEVKGGKNPLQFNDSLRNYPDRVQKLIRWIGACTDEDISRLIQCLMQAVQNRELQKLAPIPIIRYQDISIRPILFAPDRNVQRTNQIKFINGNELISFCWNCFRPENRRDSCETNYRAINNWGEQFERLVGYFKNHDRSTQGTITDLYRHFGVIA